MHQPIRRLLENIFLIGIFGRHQDSEDARKLILVNSITLFAIVVLSIIGVASVYRGSLLVGMLDLSAAALLLCCIVYLRRTGEHQIPMTVGISIMTCLYFYLFVTGGVNQTGYLWYYTFPIFTLYLMGKKWGSMANGLLFLPSVIYLVLQWMAEDPQYSQDFIIRFVPSVLCVFLFAYLFETTRLKTYHRLTEKQAELESSVVALRCKEEELKKAYDDLEDRIEKRTEELQSSNETLKREIEERSRSEERRRQLEGELVRAQKMEVIGTLAGGVAHDLNNLLSGITTYPELLLMKISSDSELREPLETIRSTGQKTVMIVQDLLTLSRRGTATFVPVDFKKVLTDYLESHEFKRLLSFHSGVTVNTQFCKSAPTIQGSVVHLGKAVMNLMTNAAEAMPSGGVITVALDCISVDTNPNPRGPPKGDFVRLSIADTGSGIPPEDVDHIFEPFFTTKAMGRSGTGLGMTVVWGTLQDHNGHIEIHTSPESGTRFDLFFPHTEDGPRLPNSSEDSYPRGEGQTVLVVDDVPEQREIATRLLKELGYSVHSVSSGESAVAFLKKEAMAMVLLDMIMMPGIDGLETLRRILKRRPDQRVVIASGFSESGLIDEAIRLGARGYLKKPYSIWAVAHAVRDALETV